MTHPLILHNLRTRFERDQIYTSIGTILISVNPFKHIPIYKPETIAAYRTQAAERTSDLPPHVYKIAADSLTGFVVLKSFT